jgi:hypothetical protein
LAALLLDVTCLKLGYILGPDSDKGADADSAQVSPVNQGIDVLTRYAPHGCYLGDGEAGLNLHVRLSACRAAASGSSQRASLIALVT